MSKLELATTSLSRQETAMIQDERKANATKSVALMAVASASIALNFWDAGRQKAKGWIGVTEKIHVTADADGAESVATL